MKVTIHQPDFMPWFGFFYKIAQCDYWVVLDHVKNNPRDSSFWGRRVTILVNGNEFWYSVPLNKPKEKNSIGIPINEMSINLQNKKHFDKLLNTIKMAYSKAPYFDKYFYLVERYFSDESDNLMKRNMDFILEVLNILEIDTKIIYSSSLKLKTESNQLLIDLLKNLNADTYLCGNGAGGYQKNELFEENNISVEYNTFTHPEYLQLKTNEFVKGLSILDMLFNVEITVAKSYFK